MKFETEENELLYRVCYYSMLPSPYEWIFNSKTLPPCAVGWKPMKISRYKARKYIHDWEQQGLIAKCCIGGQDDDGNVRCYHGYTITEAMRKTGVYDEAKKDVNAYITDFLMA